MKQPWSAHSKMVLEQAARTAIVQAEHDAMILAALAGAEKNVKEIARTMPCGVQRVQRRLLVLLERKEVHVSRKWGSTNFYRLGAQAASNPTLAERILAVLADGPATAAQIADRLGMSRPHIGEIINKQLRTGSNRKVYVRQYIKTGHMQKQREKLFDIGTRPDALRPARQPVSAIQRRSRARRRARERTDDDAHMAANAKRIARSIKPKADPVMSQFAGIFGSRQAA